MAYSLWPLYMRVAFSFLISVVLSLIIIKCSTKRSEMIRKLILAFWIIISCLTIVSSIDSVINPQIETVMGVFVEEQWYRVRTYPFRRRCELLCDDETVYLELDALTKSAVLLDLDKLEKGKVYIFTYEERENLILGVKEE